MATTPTTRMSALVHTMVETVTPLLPTPRLPSYTRPDLVVRPAPSCDPAFAACMETLCGRLDLTDRRVFSETECRLFRALRAYGLRTVYKKSVSGPALFWGRDQHTKAYRGFVAFFDFLLGGKLLTLLGSDQYATWFPWHDFVVDLDASTGRVTITCNSLARTLTPDGQPCYHSWQPRRLAHGRTTRRIAFAPHAITRLAERTLAVATDDIDRYANLGDIVAFVNHYQYFQPALLHHRHEAFALFEQCTPGFFSDRYPAEILGQVDQHAHYAYRFGYCPVTLAGDFFLATTLLVPGQRGTPEYGVVLHTSFDPGVQEQMLARCDRHSYTMLTTTQDFALLRWFHAHGVPQVIPITTPLFDNERLA